MLFLSVEQSDKTILMRVSSRPMQQQPSRDGESSIAPRPLIYHQGLGATYLTVALANRESSSATAEIGTKVSVRTDKRKHGLDPG
jgi:hypothetical protein